jgi:hypothetical protein
MSSMSRRCIARVLSKVGLTLAALVLFQVLQFRASKLWFSRNLYHQQ